VLQLDIEQAGGNPLIRVASGDRPPDNRRSLFVDRVALSQQSGDVSWSLSTD
jgi:hypothetical protein